MVTDNWSLITDNWSLITDNWSLKKVGITHLKLDFCRIFLATAPILVQDADGEIIITNVMLAGFLNFFFDLI